MSAIHTPDDLELRSALRSAVDGGPPPPPTQALVARAHRAHRVRRRRRLAVAAAGLCAASVLGATVLTPDATQGPRDVVADGRTEQTLDLGVRVTPTGDLVAEPGTTVLQRVDDPLERRPDGRSYGVVTERGSTEVWGLVDWSRAGTMTSVEPAEARFAAFEDWLAYEVSAITGRPTPDPVHFDQDGVLRAHGGARVVQQRQGVGLGRWSGPDVLTGAAEIEVQGRRQLVLARHAAGGPPTYVVLPADDRLSFEGLLERAEDLYAAAVDAG